MAAFAAEVAATIIKICCMSYLSSCVSDGRLAYDYLGPSLVAIRPAVAAATAATIVDLDSFVASERAAS